MRVQLVLDGQTSRIKTLVALAVEENVLVSYNVLLADQQTVSSLPWTDSKPATPIAPFVKGQRVTKRFQTASAKIKRFSTGVVVDIRRNRAGWSALVDWDDPVYDTDWIAVSQLRVLAGALGRQ